MSQKDEMTLADMIVEHLDKHPFGLRTEDIYDQFEERFDRVQIDEALDKLETNDRIMQISGKWRR